MKTRSTCYSNQYNGIDTVLDINGYFMIYKRYYDLKNDIYVLFNHCLIVYKNGFLLYGSSSQLSPDENDISDFFSGSYVLAGDTIYAQYIHPPYSSTRFDVTKMLFKIVDSNNIKYIEPQKLERNNSQISETIRIEFISMESLPNPNDSWLIKKKWFWCDEAAFKKWKKNINFEY